MEQSSKNSEDIAMILNPVEIVEFSGLPQCFLGHTQLICVTQHSGPRGRATKAGRRGLSG